MAWEKDGRYYYRSRREGSRVIKEYLGAGSAGQAAARADAQRRRHRDETRKTLARLRQAHDDDDQLLAQAAEIADLLLTAQLLTAGFHQHPDHGWRRRRHPLCYTSDRTALRRHP